MLKQDFLFVIELLNCNKHHICNAILHFFSRTIHMLLKFYKDVKNTTNSFKFSYIMIINKPNKLRVEKIKQNF